MSIINGGGVSGVSPQKFDTDIGELKSLITSAKEELVDDHDTIMTTLEAIAQSINNIQILTSNTNSMVNDLLYDKNSAEWIADLEQNGTSAVTYSTPDRMEYLFTLNSAVTNTKIDSLLFNYGIANNLNVGLFYQALLGLVSGVTWSNLTTFASVCQNSAAFKKVCNTSRAFTLARNNSTTFNTMANNYTVTEDIINSSNTAKNLMKNDNISISYKSSTPSTIINRTCWLAEIPGTGNAYFAAVWNWKYTTLDGETHNGVSQGKSSNYGGDSVTLTVNKFINKLELTSVRVSGSTSSAYAYAYGVNLN